MEGSVVLKMVFRVFKLLKLPKLPKPPKHLKLPKLPKLLFTYPTQRHASDGVEDGTGHCL